jgi:hypothetical protein
MDQSLEQPVGQTVRALHLLYHELRPGGSSYSYVLDTGEFEKHVELFAQIREERGPHLLPELTFDDGHQSNFEFALPILQGHDFVARFFITAAWTGTKAGYMGWAELRALHKAGQKIGAHGWSHTLLTHCKGSELREELTRPKQTLEDKLGVVIDTMSLPGGRYNLRVLEACKEAGYTCVYTSIPRAEQLPPGDIVGRLNIRGDMKLEWIADLLLQKGNILSGLERQYQIKATVQRVLGDRLYEKLWAVLNRKNEGATANEDSAHYQ